MRLNRTLLWWLVGVWLLSGHAFVHAQTTPRPPQPRDLDQLLRSARPRTATVSPPLDAVGDEAPGTQQDDSPTFSVSNVEFVGNHAFSSERLSVEAADILGRPIHLSDALAAADRITLLYRNSGFISSKAVVPPQEIDHETLKIEIHEGFISAVHLAGDARRLPSSAIAGVESRLQSDRPFRVRTLESTVSMLNGLPGLNVRSVIEASPTTPNASEVTLIFQKDRVSGQMFVDNFGTGLVGPARHFAQLDVLGWGGGGEKTSFTLGLSAPQARELQSFGIEHQQLLVAGTLLDFAASATRSQPGGDLKRLQIRTSNLAIRAGLEKNFYRGRSSVFTLGGDVQRLASRVAVLGERISADRIWLASAHAALDRRTIRAGITRVDVEISKELGGRDGPDISRFGASVNGFSLSGRVSGQWPIAHGMLAFDADAHWSSKPQIALRETDYGGGAYGRAFSAGAIIGERGSAATLEFQSAPHVVHQIPGTAVAPFVFAEAAAMRDLDPADSRTEVIGSTGIGARLFHGRRVLEFGLAKAVFSHDVSTSSFRAYFRLVSSF